MKILRASWVAPMNRPPIPNGAVAYENGRIVTTGAWRDVAGTPEKSSIEDLGDCVILPGLINAHTHLELSNCTIGGVPMAFTDWVPALIAETQATSSQNAAGHFTEAARRGAAECLHYGVTSVGDISLRSEITRAALRQGPLRVVSYGEATGIGLNFAKFAPLLDAATDLALESDYLKCGLSPHAPYSVDLRNYRTAVALAKAHRLPLATHLAEHSYEEAFLSAHAGPLRLMLDRFGLWSDDVQTFRGSAIAFAHAIGLLDHPALLAHVNYCTDDEIGHLARGCASVVYCPRTHHYFGHPPHRWRAMLAAGVNVALGTDSRASSPDLNLIEELRLVRTIAPEIDTLTLWQMVTSRAAVAIQQHQHVGTIEAGKWADFAVFEAAESSKPLDFILDHPRLAHLYVAGERVVPA